MEDVLRDWLPDDSMLPVEYKVNGQTMQEWVKTILDNLWRYNKLDNLIELLMDKKYCLRVFDLQFPLLADNLQKTIFAGHSRYWKTYKLGGKYWVCSEWWKERFVLYAEKIVIWLKAILHN